LKGSKVARRTFVGLGAGALGALALGGGSFGYFLRRINRVASFSETDLGRLRGNADSPLFDRHPRLARAVPWLPIGRFPTPVEPLTSPPGVRDLRLLVKRDDLSSCLYGGNKVRKLEHFLAEAALLDRTTLVTVGGIGSNHGLATALHGRANGFAVELALFDQPVTEAVRRNLRGFLHAGAGLHYRGGQAAAFAATRELLAEARRRGERPYFINAGGTSRLGTIGYVTAGLELGEQVRAREAPEPDVVFVPLGTCGTAAGLMAGLRIAGLRSRVCAVRVAGAFPANRFLLRHFAQDVADWLSSMDPSVPDVRLGTDDFELLPDHLGAGYGMPTEEGEAAVAWAAPRLVLDSTYTGKTLAACLAYCRERARPGETVLFWNTYNSAPVPQAPTLEGLPAELTDVVT
jgi:D-cysteine desulfhydrase